MEETRHLCLLALPVPPRAGKAGNRRLRISERLVEPAWTEKFDDKSAVSNMNANFEVETLEKVENFG